MKSLFTWLLKRYQPRQYDDEFFGRLTYIEAGGESRPYWEAERAFAPTGKPVSLFIDAPLPEQPPDAHQRAFFSAVENRFPELMAAAESVMRPYVEHWSRRPLPRPFADEFEMTSFSIPCAALEEAQWEMSFDSHTDQEHLYTLSFSGMEAREVTIDG